MSLPMNAFRPRTVAPMMTKVELSVSANDLLDMDTFSKSDPICVLFIKHERLA
jgi:hypothetical protein